MSAPGTDPQTEFGRHRWSLVVIALSCVVGALFGALITFVAVGRGDAPEGANAHLDDFTGTIEKSDDGSVVPTPTTPGDKQPLPDAAGTRTVDPEVNQAPPADPTD